MIDTQCSSCGGFCGKGWCEREDVKPKQEPVAWMYEYTRPDGSKYVSTVLHGRYPWREVGVYTAPPSKPWVPLTDEEILSHTEHIGVVRYFERLLREKNYG